MHYALDQLHILPINGSKLLILTSLIEYFKLEMVIRKQIFFHDVIYLFQQVIGLYNPQLTNRDSFW